MFPECVVCLETQGRDADTKFTSCSQLICSACAIAIHDWCPFCRQAWTGHILAGNFVPVIKAHHSNQSYTCPQCEADVLFADVRHHQCLLFECKCGFHAQTKSLFVHACPFDIISCPQCQLQMEAQHANLHICPEQMVSCTQCNLHVRRGLLRTHRKERCSLRRNCCRLCFERFSTTKVHHILEECPNAWMQCAQCEQQLLRHAWDDHKENGTCYSGHIQNPLPLEPGAAFDVLRMWWGFRASDSDSKYECLQKLKKMRFESRWEEKGRWYRGRIVDVDDQFVTVLFVDFKDPQDAKWPAKEERIPLEEHWRFVKLGHFTPIPNTWKSKKITTREFEATSKADVGWKIQFADRSSLSSSWTVRNVFKTDADRWVFLGYNNGSDFPIGMLFSANSSEGQVVVELISKTNTHLRLKPIRSAYDLPRLLRCEVTSRCDEPQLTFVAELPLEAAMNRLWPLYHSSIYFYCWPWLEFNIV